MERRMFYSFAKSLISILLIHCWIHFYISVQLTSIKYQIISRNLSNLLKYHIKNWNLCSIHSFHDLLPHSRCTRSRIVQFCGGGSGGGGGPAPKTTGTRKHITFSSRLSKAIHSIVPWSWIFRSKQKKINNWIDGTHCAITIRTSGNFGETKTSASSPYPSGVRYRHCRSHSLGRVYAFEYT